MKILQVIQFFAPQFGGTVTSVYNISKELSKQGHDVTIITTDLEFDEKYSKSIEKLRVKVIPFNCVFNLSSFLYSPSMNKWLDNNILKFDIVHMHNFRSYQNYVVYKYALKHEVPYVLQARGSINPSNIKLPIYLKIFKKIYDIFWGFKILDGAKNMIALTRIEHSQYEVIGVPDNKIKIIPNAFDFSLPNVNKGLFRSKYDIKNDEKIILFLGRIHKIKGIDLLINSFIELSKEFNNIKLVIVGPDEGFMQELEHLADECNSENKIIFTGPLYGENKFEAYIDSDIYVLPSRYEIFGNTVIESLAMGTPVIVSERSGIASFIHKNGGLMFKCNKEQLKEKLRLFLLNELLLKYYGFIGKKYVFENYNISEIVKKLLELYEEVLCHGR